MLLLKKLSELFEEASLSPADLIAVSIIEQVAAIWRMVLGINVHYSLRHLNIEELVSSYNVDMIHR